MLDRDLLKSGGRGDRTASSVARALTLTSLRQLDGRRKGQLVQFLSEAQLIGASFRPMDGIDSVFAVSSPITLEGADLRGAVFAGLSLFAADLSDTDLRNAHFDDAQLKFVDLQGANLRDASFDRASLESVYFFAARLDRASFQETTLTVGELAETASTVALARYSWKGHWLRRSITGNTSPRRDIADRSGVVDPSLPVDGVGGGHAGFLTTPTHPQLAITCATGPIPKPPM